MRPGPAGLGDHRVQLGQRVLDQLQAVQHGLRQLGMLLIEVPGQRLDQLRDFDPHLAAGQLGQHGRIALTGDQCGQHRPRGDAGQTGGDRRQLDRGVLEHAL
ncbi:hypothetical protein [Geodermatophilus sp. URMC 65]